MEENNKKSQISLLTGGMSPKIRQYCRHISEKLVLKKLL